MSGESNPDSVPQRFRSAPKPFRWTGAVTAIWLALILLIQISGVFAAPGSDAFPVQCSEDAQNCTRIASNPHRADGVEELLHNASPEALRSAVIAWVEDQPRTRIVFDDGTEFHAVFYTAFMFFPDDFFFQTYCTEDDRAGLKLHSESRLGVGDLGVNDVRVAELVAHLDKIEFEPVDECIPAPVA